MKLTYSGKTAESTVISQAPTANLQKVRCYGRRCSNRVIKGENLQVMKALLDDADVSGKVALVYIDPPFSTNAVYRHNGERTATISASHADDIAYADNLTGDAFLEFIRQRLILIRELMAPNGSIYFHIDCKIGHYIKVILDEVFGQVNFRSDITRIKCNPKNFDRYGYSNIKDMILFYSKSKDFIWNEPRGEFAEEDIHRLFRKVDKNGRRYTTTPLHAPGETKNGDTGKKWKGLLPPRGRHWRYGPDALDELDRNGLIEWSSTGNPRKIIYADEAAERGKRLQDIWEFKDEQYPCYPTAKNPKLLDQIVRTSSNPDDLVFDCFCGSGTTLLAAERRHRTWIGIDQSDIAIETAVGRLTSEIEETSLVENSGFVLYEQVDCRQDSAQSADVMIKESETDSYRKSSNKSKSRGRKVERPIKREKSSRKA